MALAAFLLMLSVGESALVRWLWAGGIILLIVSQVHLPRTAPQWRSLLPLAAILGVAALLRVARIGQIVGTLVWAVIWILYMRRSARVANTFVR